MCGLAGCVFYKGQGLARAALAARDFQVLTHHLIPPNDGGLALGQVAVAGWQAIFWVCAGYGAVCCVLVAVLLPDTLPANRRVKLGLGAMLFTAVFGTQFVLLLQKIWPMSMFYALQGSDEFVPRLIGNVLGVGVNEEVCKAIPVLLIFRSAASHWR